jgi:hypothetical protein
MNGELNYLDKSALGLRSPETKMVMNNKIATSIIKKLF